MGSYGDNGCHGTVEIPQADTEGMSFAHTTVHVTDLDRSIEFYGRLGIDVSRRFGPPGHEIAFMGDGPTKLELVADGEGPVDYPGISIGFTSVRAGELARSLDEKFVGPVTPAPGVEFYFVRDPDGYTVQILQE